MQTEKADSDCPALFVLSDNTTEVLNMSKEYVFLDEKGRNIDGCVLLEPGDKIINANGEWVVKGTHSITEIITPKQTFLDLIFGIIPKPEYKYKETYFLALHKTYGKEQK